MTLAEKINNLDYHTNVYDIDKVIGEVNETLTKKLPEHRIERKQGDDMTIAAVQAGATASGRTIDIVNELRYMNAFDKVNFLKEKVLPMLMNTAKLKSIVVTIGTGSDEADLEPVFNPDTFEYDVELPAPVSPATTTSCKVKATVIGSATLKYKIGSGSETSGTSGTAFTVASISADTTVALNVKDGDETNSYTLKIKLVSETPS